MLEEWNVTVPALTGDEERRAWVYVPDSAWADRERRYPVLYMFDGQNLFRDEDATYGKSWGLLDYLTEHNVPLIVAAVECNKHAEDEPCGGRLSEYSPFDISFGDWGDIKGRGELTMDFLINDLFKIYGKKWHVTVETSLHVTPWMLHDMSLYIDDYVVDVKDMNPEIYKKYTGQDNNVVISNLEWLIEKGKADHILVRLPLIPGYNTDEDRQKSKQTLERMGITRFNLFTYKTNTYKK